MKKICVLGSKKDFEPFDGDFIKEAEEQKIEVVFEKELNVYRHCLYIICNMECAENILRLEAERNIRLPWVWSGGEEAIPSNNCGYCIIRPWESGIWYLRQVYAHICGLPWIVYENDRFIVREQTLEDLPLLYGLYGKPGVAEYVEPLYEFDEEREFTKSYIENMYGFYGYGLWLAFEKISGKVIGRLGFSHRQIDGKERVELGYIIDADYQGKGIGASLCRRLLELGHEYWGFDEVFAVCDKTNNRSMALAQKLGFERYGTVENNIIFILALPCQKENGQI